MKSKNVKVIDEWRWNNIEYLIWNTCVFGFYELWARNIGDDGYQVMRKPSQVSQLVMRRYAEIKKENAEC